MGLLLGKAIYGILTGNTSLHLILSGSTGDKVYPIFPNEVLNPFIVYERKSNGVYTKDGLAFYDCTLTVYVVSDNYTESITIAQYVRTALERIEGTYSGVNIIHSLVSSITDGYGIDGYITTLEFDIRCK